MSSQQISQSEVKGMLTLSDLFCDSVVCDDCDQPVRVTTHRPIVSFDLLPPSVSQRVVHEPLFRIGACSKTDETGLERVNALQHVFDPRLISRASFTVPVLRRFRLGEPTKTNRQ